MACSLLLDRNLSFVALVPRHGLLCVTCCTRPASEDESCGGQYLTCLLLLFACYVLSLLMTLLFLASFCFFTKNGMYLCLRLLKIDLCRRANSPLCVVSSWMFHFPCEHRLLRELDQAWKNTPSWRRDVIWADYSR